MGGPTDEARAKWAETFALFDRDGDGAISPEELQAVLRSLGERPTRAEVDGLIAAADVNGDGRVDIDEFAALMAETVGGGGAFLRAAFASFDRDGDGYISPPELHAALRGLGEHATEEEILGLLSAADRNGDGKLDFDEFVAIMMK